MFGCLICEPNEACWWFRNHTTRIRTVFLISAPVSTIEIFVKTMPTFDLSDIHHYISILFRVMDGCSAVGGLLQPNYWEFCTFDNFSLISCNLSIGKSLGFSSHLSGSKDSNTRFCPLASFLLFCRDWRKYFRKWIPMDLSVGQGLSQTIVILHLKSLGLCLFSHTPKIQRLAIRLPGARERGTPGCWTWLEGFSLCFNPEVASPPNKQAERLPKSGASLTVTVEGGLVCLHRTDRDRLCVHSPDSSPNGGPPLDSPVWT